MNNRLEIQIGNKKLVAEIYNYQTEYDQANLPNELCVYIVDENNHVIQDICIVREHYFYNKETNKNEFDKNSIDCLVFTDTYDDDYTHKFCIGVLEDEDD